MGTRLFYSLANDRRLHLASYILPKIFAAEKNGCQKKSRLRRKRRRVGKDNLPPRSPTHPHAHRVVLSQTVPSWIGRRTTSKLTCWLAASCAAARLPFPPPLFMRVHTLVFDKIFLNFPTAAAQDRRQGWQNLGRRSLRPRRHHQDGGECAAGPVRCVTSKPPHLSFVAKIFTCTSLGADNFKQTYR